jgi:hypothetical protein
MYFFRYKKEKTICKASIQLLVLEQWKNDHIKQVIACSAQLFRNVNTVNILLYCYNIN